MGFVDGASMATLVHDRGRLDARETALLLRDVASALGYAHARGIVHRDVKTENILVDADTGRAMVTDFGIARLSESAPLTATGQMLGTVYYLSPEQISGDALDGRSDIYSLGVAGFFALSGRFPFDAPLASAVVVAHVTKAPPRLADVVQGVHESLAAIIDRCLAKSPDDRFQNCAALASAISDALPSLGESSASITQRGPTLSDTEAQAVWERAAQLQAQTGIVPRPAPIAIQRDAKADALRTSGFQLGDVRAAADEAGIPAKYVEHALAERGLSSETDLQHPAERVQNLSRGGKWIGAPTILQYEITLDGEASSRDFDILGDVIQRAVGSIGTLTEVGRSLSWHDNDDRKLQITVFARDGKTTIRATENIQQIAGGLFGALCGGGSAVLGVSATAFAARHSGAGMAVVAMFTVVGSLVVLAASIFGTVSRRKHTRLRDMVEQLALHARNSIAAT
jgi:serine/threonine-protein kinase